MKIDSNKEYFIEKKGYHILSPDGQKLISCSITKINDSYKTYLAIINLNTNKELKLNLKYNFDEFSAAWSPDNNYIAFIIYPNEGNVKQIGIIKSDNTGFRVLDFDSEEFLSPISWTNDGKYIIIGGNTNIFKIGVKQFYSDTIYFERTFGKFRLLPSNHAKYLFSNDNRYLIFNAFSVNDKIEDFFQYNNAVYAYNMESKEITRLSPEGMSATEPCLGLDNDVYFTGYTDKKNNVCAIYKVNIITKKLTKVIDNAMNPSCRTY